MAAPPDRVEQILERWLVGLDDALHEEGEGLLGSYRELARFILRHGLGDSGSEDPSTEELDRLLAAVARSNRRAGRSISSTLRSFTSPTSAVLSMAPTDDVSEEALAILHAANRVDTALDHALSRLVRILEESAERTRREQGRAMAAMMDVLSHELDNRLGAARTATDMLDNPRIELGEEELSRVSRLVRSSLDDALRTVDDVHALVESWGEEGSATARVRSMELSVLLRKLVDELRPVAEEAGVRLELASGRVDVDVDAARLRLVLYNLVSNGIKYHDPTEDDRRVRIESERLRDGRVRIQVIDNGIGIPEAELDNVFLYHYRTRVDEEIDGSGLGLAIATEAVDQLGGALEVDSDLGEGATFTMTFRPLT